MDNLTRVCTGCNIEKTLSEFGRSPYQAEGGYTFRCKSCINAYRRNKYATDASWRQKKAEESHNRWMNKRERILEVSRKTRKKNRADNPEKYRKEARDWYQNNKEKMADLRRKYAELPKVEPLQKICPSCGVNKLISEYGKNKYTRDGRQVHCKSCQYADQRNRYANDPNFKNRKVSQKKAYQGTEQAKTAQSRARHRRRDVEHRSVATLTTEDWINILNTQHNRCLGCGREFNQDLRPTKDHIVPVSRGGGLTRENTQALCKHCNSRKRAKIVDYRNPFVAMAT